MKPLLTLVLVYFCFTAVNGQDTDYIMFNNKTVINGYVASVDVSLYNEATIEFKETKKSKDVKHYRKSDVFEYRKKGTIYRVLKNFRPFASEDIFFEVIDLPVFRHGIVSVLALDNRDKMISTYMGGGILAAVLDLSLGNQPYIYILHDAKENVAMAVPSKKDLFKVTMYEFFSEKIVDDYESKNGELKFGELFKFVDNFNTASLD